MVRFSWVLLYSSGLIVYVGCSPPYLLRLGFHADADAAGTYYLQGVPQLMSHPKITRHSKTGTRLATVFLHTHR